MAEYLYMENYNRNGKMGISYKVLEHLAMEACNSLENLVKLADGPKDKPIKCSITKGKAFIKINCKVKEGENAAATASMLQEEVATYILNAIELSDAVINVNICGMF